MAASNWKYLENQFITATEGSRAKMNKIMQDHNAKLIGAAEEDGADPRLAALRDAFAAVMGSWGAAYAVWQNKKAGYGGGTATLDTLLENITKKPDPDTNAPIERWDITIRGIAAQGGALYKTLLPQGARLFPAPAPTRSSKRCARLAFASRSRPVSRRWSPSAGR